MGVNDSVQPPDELLRLFDHAERGTVRHAAWRMATERGGQVQFIKPASDSKERILLSSTALERQAHWSMDSMAEEPITLWSDGVRRFTLEQKDERLELAFLHEYDRIIRREGMTRYSGRLESTYNHAAISPCPP